MVFVEFTNESTTASWRGGPKRYFVGISIDEVLKDAPINRTKRTRIAHRIMAEEEARLLNFTNINEGTLFVRSGVTCVELNMPRQ